MTKPTYRTTVNVRKDNAGDVVANAHYVTVTPDGGEERVIGRVLEKIDGTFTTEFFRGHDPADIQPLHPEPGVRNGQLALIDHYEEQAQKVPESGDYISWVTSHGVATLYVLRRVDAAGQPQWYFRSGDGYEGGAETLPSRWRYATRDEIEAFEAMRAGRTMPVHYY